MPKQSQLDRAIAQIEEEIALLQNTRARLLAVKEPVTPRKPRRKATVARTVEVSDLRAQ